jgi:hypothetical protein
MPRNGGDGRGSNGDRRKRRWWLVSPESGFNGDGESVPCFWDCGRRVYAETWLGPVVEADRVIAGGSYRRGNIVPACRPCNLARSDDDFLTPAEIAERVAAMMQKTGRLTPALTG